MCVQAVPFNHVAASTEHNSMFTPRVVIYLCCLSTLWCFDFTFRWCVG